MDSPLSDIRLTVEADPDAFAEEIEAHLLASLRQNIPASDYAPFGIVARNAEGEILGGLIGGTSYGWLLVKMLWVADEARGQGLGTRIMTSRGGRCPPAGMSWGVARHVEPARQAFL